MNAIIIFLIALGAARASFTGVLRGDDRDLVKAKTYGNCTGPVGAAGPPGKDAVMNVSEASRMPVLNRDASRMRESYVTLPGLRRRTAARAAAAVHDQRHGLPQGLLPPLLQRCRRSPLHGRRHRLLLRHRRCTRTDGDLRRPGHVLRRLRRLRRRLPAPVGVRGHRRLRRRRRSLLCVALSRFRQTRRRRKCVNARANDDNLFQKNNRLSKTWVPVRLHKLKMNRRAPDLVAPRESRNSR